MIKWQLLFITCMGPFQSESTIGFRRTKIHKPCSLVLTFWNLNVSRFSSYFTWRFCFGWLALRLVMSNITCDFEGTLFWIVLLSFTISDYAHPMDLPVFKLRGPQKLANLGPPVDRYRLKGIRIPHRIGKDSERDQTLERYKRGFVTTFATVKIHSRSVMKNSMWSLALTSAKLTCATKCSLEYDFRLFEQPGMRNHRADRLP